MKKLLLVVAVAVGLAGPAFAWSGTDQDGARVEIDPNQRIRPGLDIEILQDGEIHGFSVESMRRSEDGVLIEGRGEDGSLITLKMDDQDQPDSNRPVEED